MLKGRQRVQSSVVPDTAGAVHGAWPQGGSRGGYATPRPAFSHDSHIGTGDHAQRYIWDKA